MFSMKVKFLVLLLIVGLLSACSSSTTQTPASQPTEKVIPATSAPQQAETPTNAPAATNTSAPTVESSPTSEPATGATVSFTNDVLPILESRCINCHGGQRMEEGLSLKTHADILSGSENGAVVVPGDSGNSLLAELVVNQKMPKRGPKLTPPQVQMIVEWIDQGALEN